mmetsp:Transcript_11710/g.29594  ORF Transcript_11710/g.29594 Transcript_11710/m.29594 type:complete len:193 (+) Transcript_11710:2289-2867(+)
MHAHGEVAHAAMGPRRYDRCARQQAARIRACHPAEVGGDAACLRVHRLTGPIQGRRGDSRILEESQLEDVLRVVQQRTGADYLIYGDAAYAESDVIMTGYKKHERRADPDKDWLTKSMNGPRTSVEWAFGLVQSLFPWVDDVAANNIAVTPVGLFYQSAVLLTNCITCANRGAGSFMSYFNLPPPSLAEYLS